MLPRLGGFLFGILATVSAASADHLDAAGHDWSGFSLGLFGGWQWSEFEQSELHTNAFGGGWWFPPGPNPPYRYDNDGLMAGVQVNVDKQFGALVGGFGFEVGSLGIDKTVEDPNAPPIPLPGSAGPVTDLKSERFASLTARVGIANDRWLAYLRGGVSVLNAEAKTIDTCGRSFCGQLTINAEGEHMLWGSTAGAGVDFAATDRLIIGFEYRVYNFEELTVSGVASNLLTYQQTISPDPIQTVRLNFGVRF